VALSKLVNAYFENCKEVAIEMREEHKRTEVADKSLKKKRKEQKKHNKLRTLFIFFAAFVVTYYCFLVAATIQEDSAPHPTTPNPIISSVYGWLWKMVLSLTQDPFPSVASLAQTIVAKMNK